MRLSYRLPDCLSGEKMDDDEHIHEEEIVAAMAIGPTMVRNCSAVIEAGAEFVGGRLAGVGGATE